MAVEQINLPMSRQNTFMSARLLGTIGMLASPMLMVEGWLYTSGYGDSPNLRFIPLLGIIYLTGWACSLTGMRQLRATGNGALSKAVFIIQLAGLFLAFLFNVQEISGSTPDTLIYRITDMAWPVSHVFMLVVGVLVLKAKVWRGWRSVTTFLCGLALPAFFAASTVIERGLASVIFGISTVAAFMALGYAVRTGSREAN